MKCMVGMGGAMRTHVIKHTPNLKVRVLTRSQRTSPALPSTDPMFLPVQVRTNRGEGPDSVHLLRLWIGVEEHCFYRARHI